MLRPRIEAVELHLGPHDGTFELPVGDRPVVVLGPNGSGKTALVEGVVACLFGSAGDPPAGRPEAWGRIRLARARDRYEIRRDLRTDVVEVRSLRDGRVQFEGVADPRSRTRDGRRYRQLLADLLGVWDLEAYGRTLFVRQGALSATRVGDHLLQVSAGGHIRVEAARREIAEAHRSITARPLHDADRGAINPRELEQVEQEMSALRHRLQSARAADERRVPLALDRDRASERLQRLSREIDQLEDAHAALVRGSAIEVSARQVKELARKLDQALDAVPRAARRLEAARAAVAAATADGTYPPDVPERLARAELRWQDLERLRGRPPRWAVVPAAAGAIGALALALAGSPLWAVAAAGAAALLAGAVWVALWLEARRARAVAAEDLAAILADVPGPRPPGPATRQEIAQRFHVQVDARRREEEARHALADALRSARQALRAAAAIGPRGGEERNAAEDRAARLPRLVARLERARAEAEARLLRERRELDRVGDVSLRLPDGVVPSEEGVAEALRHRRAERQRLQATLQELSQELLERGTPAESLDALEAALSALVPRRDSLLRKAEILEAAHALLVDAYEQFRGRDQSRLVELISVQAGRLTDGAVGPVVVNEDMEDARVRIADRLVPLASPPLSYGELHALLLAVRLGAADFLGGLGVYPPLILDEPFAHLDPGRARTVWDMLQRVAADRQVILTTQDPLLMASLGIAPDIVLTTGEPAELPPGSAEERVPAA
jgi:DNA repair exonuclease SbcCD ATPase subunit